MVNMSITGLSSSPERDHVVASLTFAEQVRQLRKNRHSAKYIARLLGEVYNETLHALGLDGVTEQDITNLPQLE